MKKRDWTLVEDKKLEELYKTTPMYELLELFPGRTDREIRKRAFTKGYTGGDRNAKIALSRTKRSVLDTYFKDKNNINAAFIAGLIASDGNVYIGKNNKRIAIKLKVDDRDYLEGIRDFIGLSSELYLVKRGEGEILGRKVNVKDQVLLQIYSVKTAIKHLEENFNITPNKTLTLQPPNITDLRAKIAYTVGYIDGDGSIYTTSGVVKGKRYFYNKLSIYGQFSLIKWFQDEVFGVLNTQTKKIKIRKNSDSGLYSLTFSESSLLTFLHEVDKLNLPKMERKWSILNRKEKPGTWKINRNGQLSSAKSTLLEFCKTLPVSYEVDVYNSDVYFPDFNISIIINDGSVPELNTKYRNYNVKKELESQGVRAVQLWAHAVEEKTDLVYSMIKNHLNLIQEKIYARKCRVREIDSSVYREFLDENHLEGRKNSGIRLGLFHNDKLVSVMGFSKRNGYYELDRFCSNRNVVVVGGFSKLLKHAPVDLDIISYSFNSYSNGNVYRKNGFELARENKNTLYYFHEGRLKNRNNFMKFKLVKLLNLPQEESEKYTEAELAKRIGAFQVFDAGTLTWKKPCSI